jgi:hypothetical protein
MFLQAFAQSRQALAHFTIMSSSLCFSQAVAQASQTSAQALQIVAACTPLRAEAAPAARQMSAQSTQDLSVIMWSCLPLATISTQCAAQASHSWAQS